MFWNNFRSSCSFICFVCLCVSCPCQSPETPSLNGTHNSSSVAVWYLCRKIDEAKLLSFNNTSKLKIHFRARISSGDCLRRWELQFKERGSTDELKSTPWMCLTSLLSSHSSIFCQLFPSIFFSSFRGTWQRSKTSPEIYSLQEDLGQPGGLLSVGHAQTAPLLKSI